MELAKKKKIWVENKKKDLPEEFLKQALGSLFIGVNSVYDRMEKGFREIKFLDDLNDLYKIKDDSIVMLDIENMEYSADLDSISYAKRMNEELCVVVKDMVVDKYQMYLYNMYGIDGVIFDTEDVDNGNLQEIIFLADVMGIELIYALGNSKEMKRIKECNGDIRVVMPKNDSFVESIDKNVFLISQADHGQDKKHKHIFIRREKSYE